MVFPPRVVTKVITLVSNGTLTSDGPKLLSSMLLNAGWPDKNSCLNQIQEVSLFQKDDVRST